MQQFMLTIKAFKVINLNGYWDLKQQNLYDFIKQIWKLNDLLPSETKESTVLT